MNQELSEVRSPLPWPAPVPAGTSDVSAHRYPGAPPFSDSDLDRLVFRGRAEEADAVLHLILSSDLLVLYALSGTGKTSLLNAGVLPALRVRNMWPLVIRLNDPDRNPVSLVDAQIREAATRSAEFSVRLPPASESEESPTLWDLLSHLEVWKDNTLQQPVLIFDQFEELFTLGWSEQARQRFVEDFGEVVRRSRNETSRVDVLPPPDVKVVLVIREDSLGELEALATDVPQIMRQRFRLLGLDPAEALAAIREPAQIEDPRLSTPTFSYTDDASRMLLDFLRARQERGKRVVAAKVDPSQLQIICQHIERTLISRMPNGAAHVVDEMSLGGEAGLNDILGAFYGRELADLSPKDRKLVRALCEKGLISKTSRRISLERGRIEEDYHVSAALLDHLVGRRLLRAEPRVGSVYYELAHDTLVGPILDHRQRHSPAGLPTRLAAGFVKFVVEGLLWLTALAYVIYWLYAVGILIGVLQPGKAIKDRPSAGAYAGIAVGLIVVAAGLAIAVRRVRLRWLDR